SKLSRRLQRSFGNSGHTSPTETPSWSPSIDAFTTSVTTPLYSKPTSQLNEASSLEGSSTLKPLQKTSISRQKSIVRSLPVLLVKLSRPSALPVPIALDRGGASAATEVVIRRG